MIGALASIILRDWRAHKLRLSLTIVGVSLGVAVYFAIHTANATLAGSLNTTVEKLAGKATLQIVAGDADFSLDVLKLVRDTPGVEAAEPVVEAIVNTSLGNRQRILILGLDTASDLAIYKSTLDQGNFIVKNPLAFSSRKDSIAVTRTLADRFGLKDGDKFTVDAKTGKTDLTVRGIFEEAGIGEVYDGNVAVMDMASAQPLFGNGNRIDRIDVANSTDVSIDQLEKDLRARVPGTLDVIRPNLRGQHLENTISAMHAAFTITSVLALTIAIFIIFNSFSISVNQRWRDTAILRSIGVERSNIRRMFIVEAIILGLLGSALGVGIGFAMAQGALKVVARVTSTVYGVETVGGTVGFDWLFGLQAFVLGVAVSLISVWLPARAAAGLDPAVALRNVEIVNPTVRASRVRIVLGLLLIAAGLVGTRFGTPNVGSYVQMAYSFAIQCGVILLLPKLLMIGAALMRPAAGFLFGPEGVIAVENMARSPKRTVATVGAIVIGLAFVFSTAAMIHSQKAAIYHSMDKVLAADMLITSSEQLHSRTQHFPETTARRISELDEVLVSNEVRVTSTYFDGLEVTLLAHDMDAYFAVSPDLLDVGDPSAARLLTSRGEGLLISKNFSLRWNVQMGDTVAIRAPGGELSLPVVGMLDYYRSEYGTLFLDRELYKRYWQDSDVDYIFIDLKPGTNRDAFRDKVQAIVADTQRAFIYTHEEYKAWVTKLLDQFFLLMYIQMIVAVLVAAIGLTNTMLISVAERTREIGVFRAIGGLRRQVIKMIILESMAIALIGLAAGAATGAMNACFLVKTAVKVVAGFDIRLVFPYSVFLIAVPVVVLLAVISAWLPAIRAARLTVVEAIGYE